MPSQFTIDPYYDSLEWRILRIRVLNRDLNTCFYCHGTAHQVDHVVPRKRGGKDTMKNLVACCATCNKTAGNKRFKNREAKKQWIIENRLPELPRNYHKPTDKPEYPTRKPKPKSLFRQKLEHNAKT